jgi:uncharacterized alkaline shock family protein YloU
MSNGYYVTINNYSRLGTMGISRRVIEGIANRAVNGVSGASVRKKKAIFQASQGAKVILSRTGKVTIGVEVSIAKGVNVEEVCLDIQRAIANDIELSCDTVPYDIKVKVVKVG